METSRTMQDDKRILINSEEECREEPFEAKRRRGRYSKRVGDQRAEEMPPPLAGASSSSSSSTSSSSSSSSSSETHNWNQDDTKRKSSVQKKSDWIPGKSWCWHLAPDGSFSTVDATATTRPSLATRKRNRGFGYDQASRRSSAPRRRRCRRDDDENKKAATTTETGRKATSVYEANWEEKFQLLLEYKKKHKTGYVPSNDPILGGWAVTQRSWHTRKKLSNYRFQKLNSIGFAWEFQKHSNQSKGGRWMEMYQHLKKRQRQGKGNHVPARKSKLSNWVGWQRYCYNRGELSKERIALLDAIGFEWDPMETNWMAMYRRLKTYEKRHGHTLVPFHYKKDPQLAIWVQTQRQGCKKQDRVDLLNDLGFAWNAIDFRSSMANHAGERSNK